MTFYDLTMHGNWTRAFYVWVKVLSNEFSTELTQNNNILET